MKKIKVMLYAAAGMLFASMATTPLLAGSADFAGPYVAIQGQSVGAIVDGTYTDNDSVKSTGSGGLTAQIGGIEIGYSIPVSDTFLIGIGAGWIPGSASIVNANDADDAADITVDAEEFYTYFIQPTVSVTDNSAIFIKYGQSTADLVVKGNFTGTASSELDGETIGIGTMTIFPTGIFMKTEAGLSTYDQIQVNDIGTAANSAGQTSSHAGKGDVVADPEIAYGSVTIGFKF